MKIVEYRQQGKEPEEKGKSFTNNLQGTQSII